MSKRAKRALNVMEGCDKKSVHSEKRAMKKRVLRKACAQESVRSEKRADSKCVFGAKIQIILVCELLLVNNDDFGMDNVPIVFRIDQTRYVGPSGHHLQKKRPLNLHISIASLN